MPFSIEPQSSAGVLELAFDGVVDREQLLEASKKVRTTLRKSTTQNVLIDMRKIDWRVSATDIYHFARTIHHPPRLRITIVCRADDIYAYFLKTAAKTCGQWVELLADDVEAKASVGT